MYIFALIMTLAAGICMLNTDDSMGGFASIICGMFFTGSAVTLWAQYIFF